MKVKKRNGGLEEVNPEKIFNSVSRVCNDLEGVDYWKIATKTVGGLFDGVTTKELDQLSISTAKNFIIEEPLYSKVAARLLSNYIKKEVTNQEIHSFSQSIQINYDQGLIGEDTYNFVMENKRKLNNAVKEENDKLWEYYGLSIVYDRYLLKHPETRKVTETPQYWLLRVAAGLSDNVKECVAFYNMLSSLEYMTSTPTLFNSGTKHPQMSSCYLLDSPKDDLSNIYKGYSDIALLSKFAGGIGVSYSRVRSAGELIKGTNGKSNGIVPWLSTLSMSVAAVNQCFVGETPVYTGSGIKSISDIVAGDVVLGIDGEYREVLEHLSYPVDDAPAVQIELKHCVKPFIVTDGHPFYSIKVTKKEESYSRIYNRLEKGKIRAEWNEIKNLQEGDFVAYPLPKEIVDCEDFSEIDAFVYGLMLGDGSISKRKNYDHLMEGAIAFHRNSDTIEKVKNIFDKKNIHFWSIERDNYYQLRWSFKENQFNFSYEDLYDENNKKVLSQRLMHLPLNKTQKIIDGLIESDGCISRGKEVTFTNSSELLIEGLRYQLLRMQVASSGNIRHRADDRIIERQNGEKINIKYDNNYIDLRIPAYKQLAESLGISELTKNNWLIYQDMLWTRIKKISNIKVSGTVYDLIVDGVESYTVVNAGLAHNGGKRKGAACVYLETWHPDIMDFLALKDQGGDHERRAHNLNLANWIPDLFMKRLKEQAAKKKSGSNEVVMWSLISPKKFPELVDTFGEDFEKRYLEIEEQGLYEKQVPVNKLWERMLRTLAQTGNGWVCFKDSSNLRGNSVIKGGNILHLSNLCVTPDTTLHVMVDGIETEASIELVSSLKKEGHHILVKSYDENSNNIVWNEIVNAGLTSYDEEVMEITTPNGSVIECTENHPFLTKNRGWVKAGDLNENDELIESYMEADHRLQLWKNHRFIQNTEEGYGKENLINVFEGVE